MHEEKIDRIFKYIDIAKIVIYFLIAGVISATGWCVKIQMTLSDVEKRLNDMQQNTQIHRDALKQKEVEHEHRFTRIEQWLSDNDLRKMRQ